MQHYDSGLRQRNHSERPNGDRDRRTNKLDRTTDRIEERFLFDDNDRIDDQCHPAPDQADAVEYDHSTTREKHMYAYNEKAGSEQAFFRIRSVTRL